MGLIIWLPAVKPNQNISVSNILILKLLKFDMFIFYSSLFILCRRHYIPLFFYQCFSQ